MASTFRFRVYSKPWLDRPFVLTGDSLRWGRYIVQDSSFREIPPEEQDAIRTGFREADPGEVATAFEHLIHVYRLEWFSEFLTEMQALATCHYAKEHVEALRCIDCTQEDFDRGRAAMASAFEAALVAVFEAAKPLHGMNADFIRCRQVLHGMHLATFADESETYDAAFTPDLVLKRIDRDRDWVRVWPPRTANE
jgi:hypothetical protein